MKEKIVFNFFDGAKTMYALCKYFNLQQAEAEGYLVQRKLQGELNQDYCFDLIKYFNIPVDKLNPANILITAKHITTLPDNGVTLQRYGLLNLKHVLEKNTPLKQFLEANGIKFDVNGKKIIVMGNELDLFQCNDDCKSCVINKTKCSRFSTKYKKAISSIYIKLYLDRSETEVFLCGKDDELAQYSCVARYPEILYNVDNLLAALQTPLNLSWIWAKQNTYYYILEFDVRINALEYIPYCIYDDEPSYDLFEKYFDLLGYTRHHFESDLIPDRFYKNVFLIKNSIDVFWNGKGKEYGQIIPETIISYKDLRVSQKQM